MKPPSQKAIDRALAILIQSINEENATDFPTELSEPKSGSTIPQLDANDQALQLAYESIGHTTKIWIATIRKPRNALTSIRKLPVELMAEIILASLRIVDRSNMKHLQRIASVCTLWWDIILSFPRFWTTISSPEALSMKLRRSGSMPLIMVLHCDDRATADRMLQLSASHMHRWKSVQTSSYGTTGLISWLTTCMLWTASHPGEPLAPQWDFAGLTSLHIADIPLSVAVSTTIKIVSVLRCCPLVESVRIRGADPTRDFAADSDEEEEEEEPDTAAEWSGQVELPRLKKLVLAGLGSRSIRIVINAIRANGLVDFQVTELPRWPAPNSEGSALLTDQCKSLVHIVLKNISTRLIDVTVQPHDFTISDEGARGKLQLRCIEPDINLIRDLSQILPTTFNVHLHVLLGRYEVTDHDRMVINTVFNHVHRIESLRLVLPYSSMAQTLRKFSTPYPQFHQGEDGSEWPGQHLVKLVMLARIVGGDIYFQEVSDAVETIMLRSLAQVTGTERPELQVFDEDGRKFVLSEAGGHWL